MPSGIYKRTPEIIKAQHINNPCSRGKHWKVSEQKRKNMGKVNLGKKLSEEIKKKMSETQKRIGNKPPSWKGKKRSVESRLKLSEAKQGKKSWNWK